MKWTPLLLLALAAPAQAADVAFVPINHQRIVPGATSMEVWHRVHDFLQDQGYAVSREDVTAGTIDSQRSVLGTGTFKGLAECRSKLFWHPQREIASLTIIIKPATDGTKVTANASFVQAEQNKKKGALSLDCTTSGVLERAVLDVAAGQPMESAIVPQ
ncbi:MAG: hypothetical protein ACYDD1_16365 [Caulobacteraceae bacterium]